MDPQNTATAGARPPFWRRVIGYLSVVVGVVIAPLLFWLGGYDFEFQRSPLLAIMLMCTLASTVAGVLIQYAFLMR